MSFWARTLFRPDEEGRSARTCTRIQVYRLLSLLAAALIPLFGLLRSFLTPEAIDPLWLRFGLGGLCLLLFLVSYGWVGLLRDRSHWMRALLYVLMAWIVIVASLNGFSGGYSVGVLAVFTILATVVGFEVVRWRPVLWFSAFAFFALGIGFVFGAPPQIRPLILLSSMASIAVVESIVVRGWASMHDALQEERDRFATLFHNLPTPVVYGRIDDEGRIRIRKVNERFEEVFGYLEDGIRGEPLQDLIVPADEREDADAIRRRLVAGTTVNREVRRRAQDGDRDFQIQVALPDEDGGEGFAIYTDITERKERERALARRRALLEAQAESSLDGLLVVDRDQSVVYYNDRFLELWDVSKERVATPPPGRSVEQVLLEEVLALVPDPEAFWKKIEYLDRHPEEESRDRVRLENGRWLDRYSSPIVGDEGAHYGRLWVFRDVTEQRRMQERLLEVQAAERRRINQEMQDEVGGLLASIQMNVGLARSQAQEADALDHIDQIEMLVRELANGVRIISRKLYPSALSDYGLAGTLPSLADEMMKRHGLSVDLRCTVESGDRFSSLVERTTYWIVQEALVNVVRHAGTGRAEVVVRKREGELFFSISDEGSGFDPSAAIGEKSFGLEGIRRRVERLRGEVRIEAEPEEGTRISVVLPLPSSSRSKGQPMPTP